jgi:hypothetical protein
MTIKMRRRKFTGPSDSLDLAVIAANKLFRGFIENDEDWDEEEDDEWDGPDPTTITEIEIFVDAKFRSKGRRATPIPQAIFVTCGDFDRIRLHTWDFNPVMYEPYDDGKTP